MQLLLSQLGDYFLGEEGRIWLLLLLLVLWQLPLRRVSFALLVAHFGRGFALYSACRRFTRRLRPDPFWRSNHRSHVRIAWLATLLRQNKLLVAVHRRPVSILGGGGATDTSGHAGLDASGGLSGGVGLQVRRSVLLDLEDGLGLLLLLLLDLLLGDHDLLEDGGVDVVVVVLGDELLQLLDLLLLHLLELHLLLVGRHLLRGLRHPLLLPRLRVARPWL